MKILWSINNDWKNDDFVKQHGWEMTAIHFSMATPKESGGLRITLVLLGIGFNATIC